MNSPTNSRGTFTHGDLDPEKDGCPVRDCKETLSATPYRGKPIPWCSSHGLRLHGKPGSRRTFVYVNGPDSQHDSLIRNFPIERAFLEKHSLRELEKAETHRLGYENAEDALTWNVFAGLLAAGALRRAAEALTGRTVDGDPELWLWGHRVDLKEGFGPLFPPLARVRKRLEPDVHPFSTEPDIMLMIPGKLLVLIEAKFTSGNSLAIEKEAKDGEKPKTLKGLLKKYLPEATDPGAVIPSRVSNPFHGQLFRNIVFAQAMAREPEMAGADWAVINLVSDTQRNLAVRVLSPTLGEPITSFNDPTPAVHSWLKEKDRPRFRFSSWEKLHAGVIKGHSKLGAVDAYLRGKSAHLKPAFNLA